MNGPGSFLPRSRPRRVVTGLVPVIPVPEKAAFFLVGMAGTRPAMTSRVRRPERMVLPEIRRRGEGGGAS